MPSSGGLPNPGNLCLGSNLCLGTPPALQEEAVEGGCLHETRGKVHGGRSDPEGSARVYARAPKSHCVAGFHLLAEFLLCR